MVASHWRAGLTFRLPGGDQYALELVRRSTRSHLTVADIWAEYRHITQRDNATWSTDWGRAKHLVRILGDRTATELTQADVDHYRNVRLAERTQSGMPPRPNTLNNEIRLLRHMINYSVKAGYVERNPLQGVQLLREDNIRQSLITEEQLSTLLKVADSDLRPILLVAYDTGMRRGELLRLRWEQVDLRVGTIVIGKTKTGYPRTVYLTDRAKTELAALRHTESVYVFANPKTGRPWYDLKKKWQRARKAAGLAGVWFHDTRRSFITNARRRGVSESVVMLMSGHRTRSAFDRYNVRSEVDVRLAVELIERGRQTEQHPPAVKRGRGRPKKLVDQLEKK